MNLCWRCVETKTYNKASGTSKGVPTFLARCELKIRILSYDSVPFWRCFVRALPVKGRLDKVPRVLEDCCLALVF